MACVQISNGYGNLCSAKVPGGTQDTIYLINYDDWISSNTVITRGPNDGPITNIVQTVPGAYKLNVDINSVAFDSLAIGLGTTAAQYMNQNLTFKIRDHSQLLVNFFDDLTNARVVAIIRGKGVDSNGDSFCFVAGDRNGLIMVSDGNPGETFGATRDDFSGYTFSFNSAEPYTSTQIRPVPPGPPTIASIIAGILAP